MRRRFWVDPEGFRLERLKAGLSRVEAAALLKVTPATVRNWESARTAVPYSAFKLLRILGGYALPGAAWRGFYLRGDTIWSPEGRSFQAADLAWWGLTVAMARSFRELQRQRYRLPASLNGATPTGLARAGRTGGRRGAPVHAVGAAGPRGVDGGRRFTRSPEEFPPSSNTGGKSPMRKQ